MTPAETLWAAADRLDALDKAADGAPWDAVGEDVNGYDEDGNAVGIAADLLSSNADLIAALRPVARPLYAWLNRVAAEYTPGDEFVSRQTNDALAVARAVLGETS